MCQVFLSVNMPEIIESVAQLHIKITQNMIDRVKSFRIFLVCIIKLYASLQGFSISDSNSPIIYGFSGINRQIFSKFRHIEAFSRLFGVFLSKPLM